MLFSATCYDFAMRLVRLTALFVAGSAFASCGGEAVSDAVNTGGSAGSSVGGSAASGGSGNTGASSGSGGSAAEAPDAGPDGSGCAEPGPGGCLTQGCGAGQWCDPTAGCNPVCTCYAGQWNCSSGCDGGTCVSFDDGAPTCAEATATIGKNMASWNFPCTMVVRFTYNTLTPLGHQFICGSGSGTPIDENTARATAQADTGFGSGKLVSPPKLDEWLFFVSPTDLGGAAAVNVYSGLTVFGASIVWAGKGSIAWPETWRHESLGDCPPSQSLGDARGFVLAASATEMPAEELEKVLARVASTAIPKGVPWNKNYVVLAYRPSSVGSTMPIDTFDEYVVLVNSWLFES